MQALEAAGLRIEDFAAPDRINGYAHFLHTLGPVLWVVRLILLACVAIHVWSAVTLHIENYQAGAFHKIRHAPGGRR